MRTLVLYHSFSGNTRTVAEALASHLGAELGEITCQRYLPWYGTLVLGFDVLTRREPRVEILTPPSAHYDLTVVGGPVWGGHAAPPVLGALAHHRTDFGRVGLFVTCNGTYPQHGPEDALDEMAAALPGPIAAMRAFSEAEIRSGNLAAQLGEFARALGVGRRSNAPDGLLAA